MNSSPRAAGLHAFEDDVAPGNFKLIGNEDNAYELYDISSDRNELVNIAAKNPDHVRSMRETYDAWATRCGVRPWSEIKSGLRNLPN